MRREKINENDSLCSFYKTIKCNNNMNDSIQIKTCFNFFVLIFKIPAFLFFVLFSFLAYQTSF